MTGLEKNLTVAKTIKLYIGGKFPRTESGRSFSIQRADKSIYANVCRGSRKDLRNAIEVAKKAQPSWQSQSAYLRGQILYRMAEMAEGKKNEFMETLKQTMGLSQDAAEKSTTAAINAFIYYAGFSDKYPQLVGCINPVAGPHHNFTTPEAVGVVGLISEDGFDFANFVCEISAIIVSGNSLVALIPEKASAILAPLAEVFATSDLPAGVINLLTGHLDELFPHFSTHMELHSISFQNSDTKKLTELKTQAATTMRRIVPKVKTPQSLEHLLSFIEYKTVWHPSGF